MLSIQAPQDLLPETEYVCQVLLREMLGIPFQVAPALEGSDFIINLPNGNVLSVENHWPSAVRSNVPLAASVKAPIPHPFLPGEDIIGLFGRPSFVLSEKRIDCGVDLFASTFFMLTRWEEDAPGQFDKHGRFPADQSLAFQAGFLHRPVVNEWAELLWQMLLQLGWQGQKPQRQYTLSVSCDVDHPRLWWSAIDRLRTIGGAIFKRGNLKEALYFIKNHLFSKQDPYDVFDEWMDLFEAQKLIVQFNFLGERPRASDCWYPLKHPFIKDLMIKIARRGHHIGFHPSYESFGNQPVFEQELASIQAISPLPVESGRQHYLRFSAPASWRQWQDAGLKADSTLGYPEAEGFRCGICHDFPVFDIQQRKMLELRESPLLAMDVTLAQYRGYTPEEALQKLNLLRQQVEKHRGEFTLLWHNSSWNTPFWSPWKKVFIDFMATGNNR